MRKKKDLHIKLTDEEAALIKRLAKERRWTVSMLVLVAIEEFAKKRKAPEE